MIYDDYPVQRRTLDEIEAEADRCRLLAELGSDGRIDVFQLLQAWKIKLDVRPDAEMKDVEAFSLAGQQVIACRRSLSRGLRFGSPTSREVLGHELGHMFLHRGAEAKARKIGGNGQLTFIAEDQSAETQASTFARALFITRLDLTSGEADEELAVRVGFPPHCVSLRREEVRQAILARLPRKVPADVARFLRTARKSERTQQVSTHDVDDQQRRSAWARTALIAGEDPSRVRSARGWRVEWDHFGYAVSQVGWTVVYDEVRCFMDLQSR